MWLYGLDGKQKIDKNFGGELHKNQNLGGKKTQDVGLLIK
jgi:hypothetical protein